MRELGGAWLGKRVLDVGCGTGDTSFRLGELVGPTGIVVGVDVSQPCLDAAGAARERKNVLHVMFERADGETRVFEAGSFDRVWSRFGVMFFADPTAAFANFNKALAPGGHLSFVCWRDPTRNPFICVPQEIARKHLGIPAPPGAPADPPPGFDDHPQRLPGPFAFAEAEYLHEILGNAGFENIQIAAHSPAFKWPSVDEAMSIMLAEFLPVGGAIVAAKQAGGKDAEIAAAITETREWLTSNTASNGEVVLSTSLWSVTAQK
jgi:SAM-dependent methyltransferase